VNVPLHLHSVLLMLIAATGMIATASKLAISVPVHVNSVRPSQIAVAIMSVRQMKTTCPVPKMVVFLTVVELVVKSL